MKLKRFFCMLMGLCFVILSCDASEDRNEIQDKDIIDENLDSQETKNEECGNGVCEEEKTNETCSEDCQQETKCGDGKCEEEETKENCPEDCDEGLMCVKDEDCPQPKCPCCKVECQDGKCSDVIIMDDCCGNGKCEEEETNETCSEDCAQGPESTCIASGGTVATSSCCLSAEDFPNLCLIGPCGCSPENSHDVKICDCEDGTCFNGEACVPIIECGNGKCEEEETKENCPEDCSEACEYPSYSENCIEVDYFECGFDAKCQDGTIYVVWHEHVFCNEMEEIIEFSCSYTCSEGCEEEIIWPENGKELVDEFCTSTKSCGGIAGLLCDEGQVCDMKGCFISDQMGTCVDKPETCFYLYDPVCGCDGKTYDNDCLRLQAGITLDHEDECEK